ncbi:Eukaryotic translation initiation factor 2-alpha kinase 1 [Liparis tanakae]|uniref:Eukaryotic translation initiation factor 2-alpha kinase 1 n=1 Tax=Liparis tanakae TaxID=230148 RepID=A0A4Z2FEF3_9TELE|nr:Eukaryotic translation initiation factor 2-alpha kinase 1 [Liparis tanakae]
MSSSTSNIGLLRSEESSGGSSNPLVVRRLKTTRTRERDSHVSLLSFASEEDDEVHFDTSDTDNNREGLMADRHYPSIQEFASAIPNHLLLGSLLEHLCFVYESNPTRSLIGQRLAAMNLLCPLAISDEFSTVRLQHNRAFTELLHAASSSLYPQTKGGTVSSADVPVTNKLDGQYYAVKKILIRKVSKDDCMKVLREVKVLSSLLHVNVVGYHTAWMEHVQPAAYSKSLLPALESPEQQDSRASTDWSADVLPREADPVGAPVQTPETGQVVCAKTMRRIPTNYVPCVFLGQGGPPKSSKCPAMGWDSSVLFEEESSRSSVEPNDNNNNACIDKDFQPRAGKKRTAKPSKEVQFHLMLYIQMQMCERSLKDWISERNSKPREEQSPRCPYACVDSQHTLNLLRGILEGVDYIHSRGIMHRDLKSDMYSVGVLALELFQPFGTEMERVRTLEDLREGRVSNSFCQRWPVLTKFILDLTNKEPSVRPTASQLLQSELLCSKDIVIHSLQRRVEEQEGEIMQLRRQISRLQSSEVS